MGFWGTTGRLLWGATKLAGKAAAVTTVATAKATVATAKVAYQNRETIADVASGTAKATWQVARLAGKGTAYVAGQVYTNRDAIAGATVGAVKGTVGAISDLSGHVGKDKEIVAQTSALKEQGQRYKSLQVKIQRKIGPRPSKRVLLDSTLVGGETLATYMHMGEVPPELQRAYELAYPNLAADHSLIEEFRRLNAIGHRLHAARVVRPARSRDRSGLQPEEAGSLLCRRVRSAFAARRRPGAIVNLGVATGDPANVRLRASLNRSIPLFDHRVKYGAAKLHSSSETSVGYGSRFVIAL